MTIQIQRGRQFVGGTEAVPLFDAQGNAGGWLAEAAKKLVAQNVQISLRDTGTGQPVPLKTQADWDAFLSRNVSTREQTKNFVAQFGIEFQDFIELVDDAAASDANGVELNLSPFSKLSRTLSLNRSKDDYGSKLTPNAPVQITGTLQVSAPSTSAIGPDILANPVGQSWDRDRTEQESWADFKLRDGGSRIFRDNTGPAPYAKLSNPKWNDPEAAKLVEEFNLPLHVEERVRNGQVELQDRNEMFRETYFDDASGALRSAGASVRARVRFDDDPPYEVRRVLVQAKEGRSVDPLTGRSAVRKFEKRWEGGGVTEQDAQKALMTGKDGASVMPVSQKLYGLVKDAGTLSADGQLRLEPTHMVLQRRRRTHLQLDNLSTVTARRDGVRREMENLRATNQPVPAEMEKFLKKLDWQVETMGQMSALLSKYGQYLPSGECFIVSADRYNVYDPASRTTQPNDIDDEQGRVGRGLHLEAEWDTASSDPFENALEAIDKQIQSNPANAAELNEDRKKLEGFRELFRQDVEKTVEIGSKRLTDAGLELDPEKKSKDDRAADIMTANQDRPVFWI